MGICSSLLAILKAPDLYGSGEQWRDYSLHPGIRKYKLGAVLGKGAFSEVVLARRKPLVVDGAEVALKIVFLGNPSLSAENRAVLKAESTILQKLHHPHIIDVRRTHMWRIQQQLIIEEELLRGGELLDEVKDAIKNHNFCMRESWARVVLKQVLRALRYMHSRNVIHRDIKHDNLCFLHPASVWTRDAHKLHVKVIDFGLACMNEPGAPPERGLLGTPGYVAPEVIKMEPHTSAMDMYAVGVIAFVLLVGCKPMTVHEEDRLLYRDTKATQYANMRDNVRWDAVSSYAQHFIQGLLELDPSRRMTASQALQHPWISPPRAKTGHGAGTSHAPLTLQESDNLHENLDLVAALQQERWRRAARQVVLVRSMLRQSMNSHAAAEVKGRMTASASLPTLSALLEQPPSAPATGAPLARLPARSASAHLALAQAPHPPPEPTLPELDELELGELELGELEVVGKAEGIAAEATGGSTKCASVRTSVTSEAELPDSLNPSWFCTPAPQEPQMPSPFCAVNDWPSALRAARKPQTPRPSSPRTGGAADMARKMSFRKSRTSSGFQADLPTVVDCGASEAGNDATRIDKSPPCAQPAAPDSCSSDAEGRSCMMTDKILQSLNSADGGEACWRRHSVGPDGASYMHSQPDKLSAVVRVRQSLARLEIAEMAKRALKSPATAQ